MEKDRRNDTDYIKIPNYNYKHFIKCLTEINYYTDLWYGFVNYIITHADEKTHGFNRVDDSPQIF